MGVHTKVISRALLLLLCPTLGACLSGAHTMKAPDAYALPAEETGGRPGHLQIAAGEIWDTAHAQRIDQATLIRRLAAADVVYVGESHDGWHHHRVQREVLEGLAELGGPMAIGLEMLPRTVQGPLDAFIRKESTEREMLTAAGWYEHWGFDFRYYRPLFRIARERGYPILGLNLPGAVVREVGRKGLAALDAKKREELPDVFLGSKEHRRVFDALIGEAAHHPGTKKKTPHEKAHAARRKLFYQAQSLWDEAMAARVAASLKEHPERRVIVFAGNGHVVYDLGISMRLRRRLPSVPQAIVATMTVEKDRRRLARQLADFIVGVPPDGPREGYPTLGVMVKAEKGGLTVLAVTKKGAAKRAGLKKKDRLLAVDGRPTTERAQLRRWLLDKKWGDTGRLSIERGGEALELNVRFEPAED